MKLSTEIKYLSNKKNILFIVFSLLLIVSWMLLCIKIDREHDRGLLTSFGYCCIFSFILVTFFSNNKITDFFTLFIALFVSCFIVLITFMLSLMLSICLGWFAIVLPSVATGFLIFYTIRLLVSFSDNKTAFWTITLMPIITALIFIVLSKFLDDIILHELGIGFPISIYLSLIIISIAALCRENNTKEETENL